MSNNESPKMNRRDLLKWSGAAAIVGSTMLGGPLGPKPAAASGGSSTGLACGGGQVIEVFPASPFILNPFVDKLSILSPLQPTASSVWKTWARQPVDGQQDSRVGVHQIWPTRICTDPTSPVYGKPEVKYGPDPLIYKIDVRVAEHSVTSSDVMPMKDVIENGKVLFRAGDKTPGIKIPASCIYGFNGTFPGPMVYAVYGKPSLVRFENHLGLADADFPNSTIDRCDFGAPDYKFLTHLHNGHTAPESDGNPNYCPEAYGPGESVDNLYLNYPAGGDDAEKQSFFWFHDHRMDFTGANVYKGLVGIYPIYDADRDSGDENHAGTAAKAAFHLPGVPTGFLSDGTVDYTKVINYDVPLVFYDCRLDDGVTPHKDFHNGCGETHPEWWGKTFFRHFPDHGFVGDIFTVNGTAYPTMAVDARQYRFRLLGASISRIYDFKLMTAGDYHLHVKTNGHVPAPGTDGQWLLPTGVQCMKLAEIAVDGGLLPKPVIKDSQQIWPAKRREVVVDFSQYMDGTATQKGDVVYLVNVSKMGTGRMPESADPNYKVPMIKFVIGDKVPDNSTRYKTTPLGVVAGLPTGTNGAVVYGTVPTKFRDLPWIPTLDQMAALPHRTFEFQRGSAGGEIQWMVNGLPFIPTVPMAYPVQCVTNSMALDNSAKVVDGEIWTIQNGGGGWVHPVHFHMEEHRIITRGAGMAADDDSKEDVVALGPSEAVSFYRRFRTFTGPYVAHCHNLAHEDHAMMFGWTIVAAPHVSAPVTSNKGGGGSGSGSSGSGSSGSGSSGSGGGK